MKISVVTSGYHKDSTIQEIMKKYMLFPIKNGHKGITFLY